MKEYELYVPLRLNDGTPVPDEIIDRLGEQLLEHFGGCTYSPQPQQGLWKMGDVVFRDEVVIFRVLTGQIRSARRFFREFADNGVRRYRCEPQPNLVQSRSRPRMRRLSARKIRWSSRRYGKNLA